MYRLRREDWPGYKMTPDHTLAWYEVNNSVIYVRPLTLDLNDSLALVDEESPYKDIKVYPPNESLTPPQTWLMGDTDSWDGPFDGEVYRLENGLYVVVFAGNDPIDEEGMCASEVGGYDLPATAEFIGYLNCNNPLIALKVAFSATDKGYIPVLWNTNMFDTVDAMDSKRNELMWEISQNITVEWLRKNYPPIKTDTLEEQNLKFCLIMSNGNIWEFYYNRNSVEYHTADVNKRVSWPIVFLQSNGEILDNSTAPGSRDENERELCEKYGYELGTIYPYEGLTYDVTSDTNTASVSLLDAANASDK